ncbi:MAG: PP2C family protein-serine/threonine phosphatase [Planctomycetota bacterium]
MSHHHPQPVLALIPWEQRLASIMEMMREMSGSTDPEAMVRQYGVRMRDLHPEVDRRIALSRRGLEWPWVRVTRFSEWQEQINPWKQPDRLPLIKGGILADLLYGDEPRIIDELELEPGDPAAKFLEGQLSLQAVPLLDEGVALNMAIQTRSVTYGFDSERLPEIVWMANLFGRATHNLVLADQIQKAYEEVDRELKAVADIQRSLLPSELPEIPRLKLAANYQTARRAGGDYYDFFPLPDGRWGIMIADVSGHGTPAAVMMAVMHSIAHNYPGPPNPPSQMLAYLNEKLVKHYVGDNGTFVTAFYGIFDPRTRQLSYSSAGHNPPRLRGWGRHEVTQLDRAQRLPLGVAPGVQFADSVQQLAPGDQLILYTDGIVEAANNQGQLFGTDRLDALLGCCNDEPADVVAAVLRELEAHTEGQPPADDQTLVVARVL